ncbi:MAG: bifunctional hydroxymethylpyrimidine kinase/phosphomethylpyrimidine kinase [Treponema sp.]|nr:bifunctional hydroxymethylpyrimidine kinase/phosphomethylpyrimidine kinase [Treponema sp.]
MSKSALVVCLNPTFELTISFNKFYENEVNRSNDYFVFPSGKGVNVARVLTQLGENATVFTHLGGNRATEFIDLCAAEHITLRYFEAESPIRTCINIVNNEKSTSTELVQEPLPVEKEASKRALDLFSSLLPEFDALVITGTRANGYDENLYPQFVELAKAQKKFIVLDVKGDDLKKSLPFHPDIIKPNITELMATIGEGKVIFEHEDTEALRDTVCDVMKRLYESYGTKSVISRGKFSTWAYDGAFIEVPNKDVPVVNTIGCGDALTAGLTFKLLAGSPLKDAVQFGMDCALKSAQALQHGINLQ